MYYYYCYISDGYYNDILQNRNKGKKIKGTTIK